MPLLDHFHAPLVPARRWESFHAVWATALMGQLNNKVLPEGYFAETQVHMGSRVEVDVATMERLASAAPRDGPTATATLEAWAPAAPALVMPSVFPDEIEIQVFGASAGATLVAAIELVSPGNKDRPEARRAFAAKCASYLHTGIGVVVVDVVTERLENMHNELVRLMEQAETFRFPGETQLYAAAYRPVRVEAGDTIEVWPVPLTVGRPLPVLPLALRGGPTLPVDLEEAYTGARQLSRL